MEHTRVHRSVGIRPNRSAETFGILGLWPELFTREATVNTHLLHTDAKLFAKDRAAAVAAASSLGYLR